MVRHCSKRCDSWRRASQDDGGASRSLKRLRPGQRLEMTRVTCYDVPVLPAAHTVVYCSGRLLSQRRHHQVIQPEIFQIQPRWLNQKQRRKKLVQLPHRRDQTMTPLSRITHPKLGLKCTKRQRGLDDLRNFARRLNRSRWQLPWELQGSKPEVYGQPALTKPRQAIRLVQTSFVSTVT